MHLIAAAIVFLAGAIIMSAGFVAGAILEQQQMAPLIYGTLI
jgi:hypothetical protein